MGRVRRTRSLLIGLGLPSALRPPSALTMTGMATGEDTVGLRHHVVVVGADSTTVRLVGELARAGEQLVVVAPSRSIGSGTAEIEALGGRLLVVDQVGE